MTRPDEIGTGAHIPLLSKVIIYLIHPWFNSSLEGGVERSETVGVRSNTPPDLRSDSPQGENFCGFVKYIDALSKEEVVQTQKSPQEKNPTGFRYYLFVNENYLLHFYLRLITNPNLFTAPKSLFTL